MIIKLLLILLILCLKTVVLSRVARFKNCGQRSPSPFYSICTFKTGNLIKSGIRGTKIGSGEVMYDIVYAHTNYYLNAGKGKQGTASGGLRGKFWFERMKADHLDDIIKTAKEKAEENRK